jgi:AraC-like DNA-binding protein
MSQDCIIYREIRPYKVLAPYIDAFWTVTGANTADQPDKILPDGCVDIIFNTGPAFTTGQGTTRLSSGEAYLVGTMTRFKEMVRPPGTQLIGVRFKPGGFSCFYPPSLLRSTADRTVEFDRSLFPAIDPGKPDLAGRLNRFFLDKLALPAQSPLPILMDIAASKNSITVSDLAKKHFLPIRRLERQFQLHVGISPKEFIDFARYQTAMEQLKKRRSGQTLLDIACACGYYDHAHLSREVKKYSGAPPSLL